MKSNPENRPSLDLLLRSFRLPTCVRCWRELAEKGTKQGWTFEHYLHDLCWLEAEDRRRRRITRLLKESELPETKTLATLELSRFPLPVRRQLPVLCEGSFIERGDNVLAFGLPDLRS